ncbi:MAG: ABC transporter [Desulfurococcales archaeon ex4484_58]|nr:MAG: ABC transporter [Desulfurococcales archaeon ex4484_58]
MIKARIIESGYKTGSPVLRDIDLFIKEGEAVLVTGVSGCGKTTLLLSITGVLKHLLYGYIDGSIRLADLNPLNQQDFYNIPRKIGVVLQDPEKQIAMPTPWDETIFTLENLGYPEEEAVKKTRETLRRYGLIDKAYQHVEDLSGGEKRRLTIASALIHEPSILFLDEPTASIDPWGIRSIREEVKGFRDRGLTTIIIEHKIKYFLDLVDRIVVMDHGRIHSIYENNGVNDTVLDKLLGLGIDSRKAIVIDRERRLGEKLLEVRSLTIGYDKPLVRDIDLVLHRGEVLAIIGANGCGKTTLLKTLIGFIEPLSGEVVCKYKMFYVPQQPDYLFIKRSLEGEVRELYRKTGVDLEAIIDLMPWYERYSKLPPYRLSHGQRRWLSIVIAYTYSKDIILLDEPTTGLDYRLFRMLKKLIDDLRGRGVGFIIATHDPRVVGELADNVVLINSGGAEYIDRWRAVDMLESIAGISHG